MVGLLAACTTTIEDKQQQNQHPLTKEQKTVSLPSPKVREEPSQARQNVLQIGLLLPLTGSRHDLGQSLKNAAEMALFDQPDQNVALIFKDTRSTAEGAIDALNALKQDRVDVVVGPVFSEEVKAVSPHLLRSGLTLFTPSNDVTVAINTISVMGFDPGAQIQAILNYTKHHDGHQVGVLLPNNSYGALVEPMIQKSAAEIGFKNVAIVRYAPLGDDLGVALDKLPLQNLDAILVVEGEKIAVRASKYLEGYKDVSPELRLIGLSAFDHIKNPVDPKLVGLIYAGVGTSGRTLFDQRYQETFQQKPERIASIVYDALNLLSKFERSHPKEPITLKRLSSFEFEGVDGFLTVHPNGHVERTFNILEVTPEGVKLLIDGKNGV